MGINLAKSSAAEIKRQVQEWSEKLLEDPENTKWVALYAPLIQMGQNELTGRFVKRTTMTAIGIAALSLVVSLLSLAVVLTSRC